LVFGLIFGLIYGGSACIQHFTLRLMLYRNGSIPLNYVRFLDYCAERIFLRKVGGGYIFVHRLLMEHFAALTPAPLPSAPSTTPRQERGASLRMLDGRGES
jgi:hypothetical protein